MNTSNIDLVGETDARLWVDAWLDTIAKHPEIPTDEGTMIAWFSNAIMSGYDKGRSDEQKRDIVEKLREIIFQAAGAATRPLIIQHPNTIFPADLIAEAVEEVCEKFGIPKENKDA